jgi:hypothetical protein
MEEAPSPACPVRTLHTLSLGICLDPPTRLGLEDSLQASISFFKMNKHSRNMVKKGWWERRHNEVREWLRTLCRRRLALGEGEWLPPLSESFDGAVTPNLGVGVVLGPAVSESLRLGQSFSESLGPTLLLL